MRVRPATNADADAIRALVFGVLDEYGLKADHEGADADLDDLEGSYIACGGLFEVVEDDDGRMIGTVGLYPKAGGVCELRKMYLLREKRGQGIGKMLMDRVLDQARNLGFRRIELETAGVLIEAIGLYKRYGFRPIDPERLCARCDEAFALDLI